MESPNRDSKSPKRDSYVLNIFLRILIGSSISQGTFILVHHLVGIIPTRDFPLIKGEEDDLGSCIVEQREAGGNVEHVRIYSPPI